MAQGAAFAAVICDREAAVSDTWRDEAERLRASSPRHLLFLCVANSARSQMAEGIARAMAPASSKISSAGSNPATLNPLAVKALAEVGIDISSHRSKSVNDIPPGGVDAVITLCAEEVCPVWLGEATRLHWGLPDPAHAGRTDAERLRAFRGVRDELRKRLAVVFAQPDAASVRLAIADERDLADVKALLDRLHLPASDIGTPDQRFVIARSGRELVGCAGLEAHGDDAILRSLAVVPRFQGSGLGRALYDAIAAEAQRSNARALYLLTTSAESLFARLGFTTMDRGAVPAAVAASAEFRSLCPTSATCMTRALRRVAG